MESYRENYWDLRSAMAATTVVILILSQIDSLDMMHINKQ